MMTAITSLPQQITTDLSAFCCTSSNTLVTWSIPEEGAITTQVNRRVHIVDFRNAHINQYVFCDGNPVNFVDPMGLDVWIEGPSGDEPTGHISINVGDPFGEYEGYSYGLNKHLGGSVYKDVKKGGKIKRYLKTTPEQDKKIRDKLREEDGASGSYSPWSQCRTYTHRKFNETIVRYNLTESEPPKRKRKARDFEQYMNLPIHGPTISTTTTTETSSASSGDDR